MQTTFTSTNKKVNSVLRNGIIYSKLIADGFKTNGQPISLAVGGWLLAGRGYAALFTMIMYKHLYEVRMLPLVDKCSTPQMLHCNSATFFKKLPRPGSRSLTRCVHCACWLHFCSSC